MISFGAAMKGSLALHMACKAGRLDLIQYLLDEGADMNENRLQRHNFVKAFNFHTICTVQPFCQKILHSILRKALA